MIDIGAELQKAYDEGYEDGKRDAAAAIEELQAVLKEADKKQEYQHDCICELTAENEELKAEVKRLEPKRGEWIYKPKDAIEMMFTLPKCSVCGY